MEILTVVIYFFYYLIGNRKTDLVPLIFMLIWMLHYFQRTFIFPLLIRGKEPMHMYKPDGFIPFLLIIH